MHDDVTRKHMVMILYELFVTRYHMHESETAADMQAPEAIFSNNST